MRTWKDYKEYVKKIDVLSKSDLSDIETQAAIISAMIQQHEELKLKVSITK